MKHIFDKNTCINCGLKRIIYDGNMNSKTTSRVKNEVRFLTKDFEIKKTLGKCITQNIK